MKPYLYYATWPPPPPPTTTTTHPRIRGPIVFDKEPKYPYMMKVQKTLKVKSMFFLIGQQTVTCKCVRDRCLRIDNGQTIRLRTTESKTKITTNEIKPYLTGCTWTVSSSHGDRAWRRRCSVLELVLFVCCHRMLAVNVESFYLFIYLFILA